MKRIWLCAFALTLAAAGAAHADAGWGLRAGATFEPDQFHVGAHVNAGELFRDGWFIPNIEVGFGSDLTLVALNPELVYRFGQSARSDWAFYIGGGLGINYTTWDNHGIGDDSDTSLGVNVLGGMNRKLSSGNDLFIELKMGLSDETPDAKVTVGMSFF